MFEKFLAWLKSVGLVTDANEAEIAKKLKEAKLEPEAPAAAPKGTDGSAELLRELAAIREDLKQTKDALAMERAEREKGIKAQQEQMKAAEDKKVAELVARALKEGKIDEAGKEALIADAKANYVLAEKWVNDKPVIAGFKPAPEKKSQDDGKKPNVQQPTGDARLNKVLEFSQAQAQ